MEVPEPGWERLERLVALWQRYGRAINLVGSLDRESLVGHIQEALQCVACVERLRAVDERCGWVDVGSGGGLPGLVVAAVRGCSVVLVEPRQRRAAFLDLGLAAVGAERGAVVRARWGKSTWQEKVKGRVESRDKDGFLILSSRAVFSPETWLAEGRTVVESRGILLCHVQGDVKDVGGEEPVTVVRDGRWSIMGFGLGEGVKKR